MKLAQSIIVQARKLLENSDGKMALTKYFEAIELGFKNFSHHNYFSVERR